MRRKLIGWIALALCIVMMTTATIQLYSGWLDFLPRDSFIDVTNSCLGMGIMIVMLLSMLLDTPKDNDLNGLFFVLMVIEVVQLFLDVCEHTVENQARLRLFHVAAATLFYEGGLVMSFTYYQFVCRMDSKQVNRTLDALTVTALTVGTLTLLANLKGGFYFTVDGSGCYTRSPTYGIWLIWPTVCVLCGAKKLITIERKERYALASYALLPYIAILWRAIFGGVFLQYMGTLFALMLIYMQVFISRGQQLAQQEKRITRQRMELMVSQIQPHFIFNALNSIRCLSMDNEEVSSALYDFSQYLRMNLDSISSTKPVQFEKELEHTKQYLRLEKLRFDERLAVEYDIQAEAFLLPSLSLQPIVENAVQHGLCRKIEGGRVIIRSREQEKAFTIEVQDDGIGFDVCHPVNDGRIHVGLKNVAERLKTICGGSLTVESTPGKGTTVIITIPKNTRMVLLQELDRTL